MVVTEDGTRLKKIMEKERVFELLASLNPELDQVRVKILGKNLFHPPKRFNPM